MRRKKWAWTALALALALSACRGPAPAEETPAPSPTATAPAAEAEGLDFVLPCYPGGGFHPITGGNRTNLTLSPLMYRGLFALDRTFQPRNDLCAGYTVSEDGLTWTFRLAAATFSDNTPLTGAEAAASLNLARQSERYGGRLAGISRVTAGEGEVTVTLSRPNGALPALLDVPIVKETGDPARPLGTGPYYLTGEGEELALTARTGAAVPLAAIPLRSIGASDDLVYAFDAREISLVDTDLTGTNALGYSGRFEAADYPTTTRLYVGFNAQSGACRDSEVRRALSLAFDRRSVAGKLLAGHAVAAALPVHPESAWYDAELAAALSYDQAGAWALLEEAGWKLGEDGKLHKGRSALTLRLVVNQENTYKVTVAEALGEALTGLGCTVTVEKLPWENYLSALSKRGFDLYLGETTLTADFDLGALLGPSGSLNYGGYIDSQTNALMDACRAAEEPERAAAAAALCARVAEMAPIAPLCFKNGSLLTQWGQVSGAAPTQRDVFAGLESWNIKQF